MVPELEKPRVTEIQVRMDCNGCVHKIKKALHGINGIYDLYIDFPQQKLTIIGRADPEKILKAIRNTRRTATICFHTEPTERAVQPTEQQAPEGGAPPAPASDLVNPPPSEAPQAEAVPSTEPPKDPPPPPENPPPQEKPLPSPVTAEDNASQPAQPPGPKDVGEVHVIYHHPPDYSYRYGYGHTSSGLWNRYHNNPACPPESPRPSQPSQPPRPIYVTHSYNTYMPSPYVTGYEYIHSPPQPSFYGRMDYNNDNSYENRNGNITSMFSDENPNACTIV